MNIEWLFMEVNILQNVVIKHNRYGMELVLNPDISFEELLEVIIDKFQASGDFFKDKKMAISFKGRDLSEHEMMRIVDTIMANSTIQIVSIMDNDSELEQKMKAKVDAYTPQPNYGTVHPQSEMTDEMYAQYAMAQNCNAEFYKGNLRSGQVLECAASVTLIGDVNPGAKIISEGNIVVLGALKGNAHAGVSGNDNCFIFALDMSPIQLQIGQYFAKSPDKEVLKKRLLPKKKTDAEGYSPRIATAQEGTICIESMKKRCLDNL